MYEYAEAQTQASSHHSNALSLPWYIGQSSSQLAESSSDEDLRGLVWSDEDHLAAPPWRGSKSDDKHFWA